MATAQLIDQSGAQTGTVDLAPEVFEVTVNVPVMHQALLRQLNNARQGTHDTKTRAEVSGGGRKPHKQKGTGRARQGSIRSPHYAGGGIVFGPHPRSYAQDMPRKQRRLAVRSALSVKAEEGHVRVLEGFELETPKTRSIVDLLAAAGTSGKVLLALGGHNQVLERSARNVPEVRVILAANLNVRDILGADWLVLTRDALEHVLEVLG